MKDEKHEVLIIGEGHPTMLIWDKELDENTILHKARAARKIVRQEIDAIKKFCVRKILYENIRNTKENNVISDRLLNADDFESGVEEFIINLRKNENQFFEELALRYKQLCAELGIPFEEKRAKRVGDPLKVLAFLLFETKVQDVRFLEDPSAYDEAHLYCVIVAPQIWEHDLNPEKLPLSEVRERYKRAWDNRENLMIKNAREQIVDKTVIICGAWHVDAMMKGLKDIAYLLKPVFAT